MILWGMKYNLENLSFQLEIILSIQPLFLEFLGRMVIIKKMKHWLLIACSIELIVKACIT